MSRETGYYWCKLKRVNSEWETGFYNAAGWQLTGLSGRYQDADFDEIDERRITREPEPKNGNHLLGTETLINPHYCAINCDYTGECRASFTADEPCRRNPPSQDWIRARDPNKKGNL